MADADKDRVAKLKASLPPMPKQAKAASEPKAEKAPRAKSAYMVSSMQRVSCHICMAQTDMSVCTALKFALSHQIDCHWLASTPDVTACILLYVALSTQVCSY